MIVKDAYYENKTNCFVVAIYLSFDMCDQVFGYMFCTESP
jgi:hypothetical protein